MAEIAAMPVQHETIRAWKTLNSLKPIRPMVMVGMSMDHIPWNEMEVDEELKLQAEDDFSRDIERKLRRTLYAWKHMRADMVVEPYLGLPKIIRGTEENLGISPREQRAVTDPERPVVGHYYFDQFQTEEDLGKIKPPEVALDAEATAKVAEMAAELFRGVLEVRVEGHCPRFTPWDRIVEWRGAQNTLMDLAMRPEFMHAIMSRTTQAFLSRLDQLEEQGLLGYGQGVIKNSGAYTDELPATGFDPEKPRTKDLWSTGMAQVFAAVSPAMHKEFELDYAVKWYERFGLVYYGCCEPLHDRIDLVSTIPHLRKISMSPYVDQERGAESIGPRFVFSRKPNPSILAGDSWDPEMVRTDLKNTMDICARYNCPLEFIIQDISTVRYQPQRLWEWVDIAMDLVRR